MPFTRRKIVKISPLTKITRSDIERMFSLVMDTFGEQGSPLGDFSITYKDRLEVSGESLSELRNVFFSESGIRSFKCRKYTDDAFEDREITIFFSNLKTYSRKIEVECNAETIETLNIMTDKMAKGIVDILGVKAQGFWSCVEAFLTNKPFLTATLSGIICAFVNFIFMIIQ